MSWRQTVEAWSKPPVEGLGYVASNDMLAWSDDHLREVVAAARLERYGGWRNHEDRWVEVLHADVAGRTVIDFGCGFGLEALALAEAGAIVTLADITPANTELAARVIELHNQRWHSIIRITRYWPFVDTRRRFDIFYCNGVLHHIPWAVQIMERAWGLLAAGGEARLMVYTDQAWREATGTPAPADPPSHPKFALYVAHMDGVGDYADYYTPERLIRITRRWFKLDRWTPLDPTGSYAAAILTPKEITA